MMHKSAFDDSESRTSAAQSAKERVSRRNILLGGGTLAAATAFSKVVPVEVAQAQHQGSSRLDPVEAIRHE